MASRYPAAATLSSRLVQAKGDLIVGDGPGTLTRVPAAAANGQALMADSTAAGGVAWGSATPANMVTTDTVQTVTGQKILQPATSSTAGAIIRGVPSQGADLLRVEDSAAVALTRITATGQIYEGDARVYSANNPPPVKAPTVYAIERSASAVQTLTTGAQLLAVPTIVRNDGFTTDGNAVVIPVDGWYVASATYSAGATNVIFWLMIETGTTAGTVTKRIAGNNDAVGTTNAIATSGLAYITAGTRVWAHAWNSSGSYDTIYDSIWMARFSIAKVA